MRDQIREFIEALSKEEQMELAHTLVARWAKGVTDDRSFLDPDGVVVGYFVPYSNWIRTHPMAPPPYRTQEEASEAARNGRSLSEIVAAFNAMYPPEPEPANEG
jgi:hypothetical protein